MWGRVRKALRDLDPVRIENKCELGTPDVNISTGEWIELKWLRSPPKRGGVIHLDHYTEQQKTWAIRRIHAGGRSFVLLKVSNEWLLFTGLVAAEYLNKVSLEELKKVAVQTWKIKLSDSELKNLLLSTPMKPC